MSDDFSAILDVAEVPEVTPAAEPTPTSEPELDTPAPETDAAPSPDGAQPESEPAEPGAEPGSEPPVDGRTNPAQIRSALKAFRDSDPKNAPVARELNDGYGRYLAYKNSFPTVAEARDAKAFLDANGGVEGLSELHSTIQSVNETDNLLYSGDPRVLDNIIEDMRRENKLDAFSKLASPYLDKLRSIDEKGYFEAIRPHFYQGLVATNVPEVVNALAKALSGEKPDVESAKGLLSEFSNWLNGLRDSVERSDRSKLDPDRQAFEKQVSEFQTAKQKEFQEGVASSAESHNNQALGGALKPYLKLPYFKQLATNRASMTSLAREIKSTLMDELGADKSYQSQMDAFFAAKSPDKARISQYHNSKVDAIAPRIVKQVIENRYPDYAKKTAAPARQTPAPNAQQTPQSNKPTFIKSKPEWEQIDWEKDPQKMLFITGRAFLKGGKFVTWNKKYA